MGLTSSKRRAGGQDEDTGSTPTTLGYRHAHRKMPYRSERLELSLEEKETLDTWLKAAAAETCAHDEPQQHELGPQGEGPVRVIFDTDIGTDVDDALALLMLLHLPKEDVELLGVTTTYGYTQLRARIAQAILTAYEQGQAQAEPPEAEAEAEASRPSKIPVIPGAGVELGTHRDVWHTGTEGMGLFPLDEIDQMMAEQRQRRTDGGENEAARFIVDTVRAHHPRPVVVIGLGALTNVAAALALEPSIVSNMRLVYMGMGHRMKEAQADAFPFRPPDEPFAPGHVYHHYPNHNISADTLAAVRVFATEGLRIDVINDAVTNKLWWTGEPCLGLMHATAPPESEVVGRLLRTWLHFRSGLFFREVRGTCPHDPLTVAEAVYPGRFVHYARGRLMIHDWAGFSTFVLDEKGPHRIGVTVDQDAFLEFLSEAVTRGLVSRAAEEINDEDSMREIERIKIRTFTFKE